MSDLDEFKGKEVTNWVNHDKAYQSLDFMVRQALQKIILLRNKTYPFMPSCFPSFL